MISKESTDVIVAGITGNLGRVVAEELHADDRYNIIPYSIGRKAREYEFLNERFTVITAEDFENDPLGVSAQKQNRFVVVDASNLSHLDSARIFAANGIPTLQLGTTGHGDKEVKTGLKDLLDANFGHFHLLQCMNAAIPVISFINSLRGIGEANPKAFAGCEAHVAESHQQEKKSVPATAQEMKRALESAGAEVDEIESVRDPQVQLEEWGVPEEYLGGHGYHRVTVTGADLALGWNTKINGRRPYAIGVRDLVLPDLIWNCQRTSSMLGEYQ